MIETDEVNHFLSFFYSTIRIILSPLCRFYIRMYSNLFPILFPILYATLLVKNSFSLPPQILCGKPLESGSCLEVNLIPRYFFNTMNNSCQEYLGCEGPGNNFESASFCAAVCGASKIVKMNHDMYGVKPLETCFKPKATTHPSSVIPNSPLQVCDTKLRFYFDSDNNVCHQFLYDDPCYKNGMEEQQINVFDSEEHCSTSCPSTGSAIFLPFT